ncbi:MAG: hypothetical protein K0R50_1315 [Eubacterium sp.]|jgi:spore germination protein KB|nr:hypothetical protein [Eubacterium sp.]
MIDKQKELISSTELWASMFIYISADAMTAPIGGLAGNQSWMSIIIGIIFSLGITWLYTHLSDSHPGKSIIEIGEVHLGKWGGKIVGLLFAWFSFELCSYNLKNNWQMTSIVALPHTPVIVIALAAMIFVVWIAYGGIETISRLSLLYIPVLLFFLGLAFILLTRDFNFQNLLPVTGIEWRKVLYASFHVTTLPLTLTIVFVMIFPSLNKKRRAKKPSLYAVLAAGLIVLISDIMYILVLGPLVNDLTYPGYTTFSYIEAADFLDRAEILFYTIFISINIIEISISLYVAALCLAKIFGLNNYRILLIPLGFIAVEQSTFIVKNHSDHISIAVYGWPWYAIIFQFFIPFILIIISAFHRKKQKT